MCDSHPDFYRESPVRARTPHRCDGCAKAISPGERYVRVTGKWEGELDSFAYHPACLAALQNITDEDGCSTLGDLRSAAHDNEVAYHAPMLAFQVEALTSEPLIEREECEG